MKQCPRCKQTYSDEQLNFCLEDGELLTRVLEAPPPTIYADDSPTVRLNDARATNTSSWPSSPPSSPPAAWTPPGMNAPQAQFSPYLMNPTPNQTLAVVSLGLGIGSLTVGWCCYLGILLSPAAIVTGLIALSQIKKNPTAYTGRGLAIGGIVTAAIFLSLFLLFIIIWGFSMFLGGMN